MKKRLCSLLLAVLMLLSILPTGVMATDSGLTAAQLQMHVRVWNDGTESVEIVTDSWQRPLYDRWDAKFFMVYPNGTTKQVDPQSEYMGRSTHIDVIGVDDAGWAEHKASQIGDGIIVYTENGTDYTIDVKIEYPNLVMYNAATFDANSIVETLMLSEDQNVFYIALSPEKQNEGLYMTEVHSSFADIADPSVTDIFTVELLDGGKYAKLTAKDLNVEGHYHFEAEVTNGLENGYHGTWGRSVRVENDMPGLYFCYGDRDDATRSWFINFDQIDSEWYSVPGHNKVGAFYFGKKSDIQAGKAAPIPLGELTFVGDDLEAENLQDDYRPTENLLTIDCTGFDAEYIRYTKDGINYDMPVRAELPDVGFYSSNTADEDTFIYRQNPFTVTETSNTLYLCANDADHYRPVSIEKWDSEIEDLFTVTTDGSALKLTVNAGETVPNGNFEVRVNCERLNGSSWHTETRYVTLSLENGMPGLYYCDVPWNEATDSYYIDYSDVRNDWRCIPGNTKWVVFYYGLPAEIKAGTVAPLTKNDLTFYDGLDVEAWDSDREEQMPANALRVRCTGFGTKGIGYTVNDVTYSIEADPHLPEIGYYTTAQATESGFLFYTNPFTVTEDDRTFYICPEDPDEITILSVGGWNNGGEDLFETELTNDGYVEIKVNDEIIVPNDSFELEVTYQNRRGTETDGIRVWLENGQPALMFRHLEWDDEEQEWVENRKNPLETALYAATGDSFPVQFYYGTADRKTRVDLDELTFPKGIVSAHEENGVVRLEVSGFNERGVITYTDEDGEIASMQVRAEQPDFAFYSSTTASKETWLGDEFTLGGTDHPYVYVVAEPGRTITDVEYIRNTQTDTDVTGQFVIDVAGDGSYAAISLNENDKPTGNTHYRVRVNDANGWWNGWFRLNRGDLTQLATPTDLVWHKEYQQWYDEWNHKMVLHKEDRMGAMSFEVHGLCQNRAEIEVYSAADGYQNPVLTGGWGFGDTEERTHFGVTEFIYADLPSGTYKFRVRNEGDGTKYRSSEWSAMSAPFTYIRPTQRLEAPDADTFGWKKGEETYHSTWDAPTSVDAGYFEIKWSCEDPKEGRRENYGTFDMRFDAHEENYPHYEDRIHDRMLSNYGTNDIRFRVRVIPTDITKYRISKWSDYSPALDLDLITDTVNDKLDKLLPNTSGTQTTPTVEDVQKALEEDTADLRTAMAADLSVSGGTNSGTLDRIAELEKTAANNVAQVIDAKNSAPQAIQDIASGVTMIGATLNLADKNPESGKTPTVTLELDVPKNGDIIKEQKHNAVQFSMKLNGAIDKDDKEQAGQQLIVPIVIDMPVPETIENPNFLVILHRLMDGSIEQMWPHIYEKTPNVWHARFVVDSFSDFAMLEYTFGFDVETVEKMVGDEDFTLTATGAADGAEVTYESSNSKIAAIDDETGEVTIRSAGTVTITATAEKTGAYPEISKSYTLIIHAKEGGEETGEVSAEPEYSIESITLYDADNKQLNAIPTGSFKVAVEIEKLLNTDEDAHLLLAAYTADGQYLDMYPTDVVGLDRKDSDTLTLEIDNPNGNIGELRAYVMRNMTPLSEIGLWDPAPANLSIEDEETINGGTYLNVTIEKSVKDGEVKLQNALIKGNLIIRGGGSNSIIVDGCTIEGEIIMEKEGGKAPRLYLIDSEANEITVNTPAILEMTADASVGAIATVADLTVQGEKTAIGKINIDKNATAPVTVTVAAGSVSTISVDSGVQAEIVVNGSVTEITGDTEKLLLSTTMATLPTVKVNGEEQTHIHQWDGGVTAEDGSITYTCSCGKTKVEKEEKPITPDVPTDTYTMAVDVTGSTAVITVEGALENIDGVAVQLRNTDGFSDLGYAEYVESVNGVHSYTFINTEYEDASFIFKLMVDGSPAVTSAAFSIPKEELSQSALLPQDLKLQYTDTGDLRIVFTPPTEPTLINGSILWTTVVNNDTERLLNRSFNPTVPSIALLNDYSVLDNGKNILTYTVTVTPTEAAMEKGYTKASTTFTATVNYASETPTFDTSKVKATFTDAVDGTGAVISGKKTLTVTGLKPNQAYSVIARVGTNGVGNLRSFITDANGTGSSSWVTSYAFTQCTITEVDISDITATTATVVQRPYAGTFPFEGVVIPTSGNAWLCATNNNIQLQWDAKPNYTGYYYINGTRANTYTTYTLINIIRNMDPGTYDLMVSTSTDSGETLTEWAKLDKALVITGDSYTPELTITGQDNGGYLFTPAGNTNAFYEYVLRSPEGNTIKNWWIGADSAADVAPYDGCTFLVREMAWKATGTKLSSVVLTRSGETELGFTPYDFSDNIVTITEDNDEALIAALRTGGKVILESDVTITTNDSRLYRGGDVILDLNGHIVTITENDWTIENGKKVTIMNSTGSGGVHGSTAIRPDDHSTLVIEGGSFGFDPSAYLAEGVEVTEQNGLWTVGDAEAPDVPDVQDASVSFRNQNGFVYMDWQAPAGFTQIDGERYVIEIWNGSTWLRVFTLNRNAAAAEGSATINTYAMESGIYTKVRLATQNGTVGFEADCNVTVTTQTGTAAAVFAPVEGEADTYDVTVSGLTVEEGGTASVEVAYRKDGSIGSGSQTINFTEQTSREGNSNIAEGEYRIREYHNIKAEGNTASFTIYEGAWKECFPEESVISENIWFTVSGSGTYASYYVHWTPATLASGENYYVNGERITGSNTYKLLFNSNTLPFDLHDMDIVIEKGVYNGERTVLYTAKNAIKAEMLPKAAFAVVGQDDSTYLLKTESDLTGMNYYVQVKDADGTAYMNKIYAVPNMDIYPWDGSTLEVMAGSFAVSEDTHTLTFTRTPTENITAFARPDAPASTTVTTVDELKAALLRGGTVTLGADISTTSSIRISGGEPVELILNGRSLETGGLTFENGKQVTIDATAENSRLTGKLIVNYGPSLIIKGGIYDRISATKMASVSITDAEIANTDKATAVVMSQCGRVELADCTVNSVTNTALDVGTCDTLTLSGCSFTCSGTGTGNLAMDIDYVDNVTLNDVTASAAGGYACTLGYGSTAKIIGGSYTRTSNGGAAVYVHSFDDIDIGGTEDENLIICGPLNGLDVSAEKSLILRDITAGGLSGGYCSGFAVQVGSSSHTESPVVTLTRINAKGVKALSTAALNPMTIENCTFTGDPSYDSSGMYISGTTGVSILSIKNTTATGSTGLYLYSHGKAELTGLELTGSTNSLYASTVDQLEVQNCTLNGDVSIINQSYDTPAAATLENNDVNGRLYVSGGSVPSVHQTVTIHSGSFTMLNESSSGFFTEPMVYSYDYSDIAILGGTFLLPEGTNAEMFGVSTYGGMIEVSGGIFNRDPSAYIVEGVEVTEQNGLWTVGAPAEAPVPVGEAWLSVTEEDILLNWTAVSEGYEVYFQNQYMGSTSYSLLYDARTAAPGAHDLVIYISDDWGATMQEWIRLEDALIITQTGEMPQVSIEGQADGSFKFVPAETDCAGYDFTLYAPDDTQISWAFWIKPNGTNDMFAPYAGCTFMVNEIDWDITDDQLTSVEIVTTGKQAVAFTPYDFSDTVVTITSDDPHALTAALRAGGKVVLESDVTYTYSDGDSFDSLCCGDSVILDLNGHTITLNEWCDWYISYGKQVTIRNSGSAKGGIYGPACVYMDTHSNLVIEDGAYVEYYRYN